MKITTVGIDLAKSVIQVHGVDERGKAVLRKQLRRNQVVAFFANLPACLVGMEACGSAHHWARKLGSCGHTVKLMPFMVRTSLLPCTIGKAYLRPEPVIPGIAVYFRVAAQLAVHAQQTGA